MNLKKHSPCHQQLGGGSIAPPPNILLACSNNEPPTRPQPPKTPPLEPNEQRRRLKGAKHPIKPTQRLLLHEIANALPHHIRQCHINQQQFLHPANHKNDGRSIAKFPSEYLLVPTKQPPIIRCNTSLDLRAILAARLIIHPMTGGRLWGPNYLPRLVQCPFPIPVQYCQDQMVLTACHI